jgi:hypothetical protein
MLGVAQPGFPPRLCSIRERLRSHSTGVYANFISDKGADGVEAAYGQRLERLTRLKNRYVPTNLFRMNANIDPSQRA